MRANAAKCGTPSGWQRHNKLGETKCGPCRATYSDHRRARYLRAKRGYSISIAEALAELGLPPDRIPAQTATGPGVSGTGLTRSERPGQHQR